MNASASAHGQVSPLRKPGIRLGRLHKLSDEEIAQARGMLPDLTRGEIAKKLDGDNYSDLLARLVAGAIASPAESFNSEGPLPVHVAFASGFRDG